jgi:hypothetical protein
MTDPIVLTPIGVVRGGRSPIFENHWGAVVSRLVLDPAVLDQAAIDGLSEFSHIKVAFHFRRGSEQACDGDPSASVITENWLSWFLPRLHGVGLVDAHAFDDRHPADERFGFFEAVGVEDAVADER